MPFNVKLHFIDLSKGTVSGVFILTCCYTVVQQYLLLETSRREPGDSWDEEPIGLLLRFEGILNKYL